MHVRWICLLLTFCTASPILADDEPPPAIIEIGEWQTDYYLQKDARELPRLLKAVHDSEFIPKNFDSKVSPFSAFFAVVFDENPKQISRVVKAAEYHEKEKEIFIRALWLCGHEDEIRKHFGDIPEYAKTKSTGLKKLPIREPGDLDAMWGAFMASGDVSYVARIIDVLDPEFKLGSDKKANTATRLSAEWSLKSNLITHELVHRLIQDQAKSRTGVVKKKLEGMLASIPKVALPHKDGEFSADLFLMDEAGQDEFKKPANQPLKLHSIDKAHRGDIVAIKVVFAGISLTKELKAEVRYDLKILDPDGKLYEETDLKGVEALRQKVPTKFRFFDNFETVMIRFEPKDKAGKYKVFCTVNDKVGKKSVKLEREITLEE